MKKRFIYIFLILLSLCLITACGKKKDNDKIEVIKSEEVKKDEHKTKELTCKTDLSSSMQNQAESTFSVTFIQDQTTYDFTSGEATIIIDYTKSEDYTEEALKQNLDQMKTAFCAKDYFGEGTTKECDMQLDGKVINIQITIDTDAFLKAAGVEKNQLNTKTLESLRTSLESGEAFEYKCSIK